MAVEPPSKKQRLAELSQADQPFQGQAAKGNALIEAVKALLEPEAQRQQAGKGARGSNYFLLRHHTRLSDCSPLGRDHKQLDSAFDGPC